MTIPTASAEPDLNLLRVFEALFDEGSASQAALRLNVSQSAVSQRLKELRAVFGDPLFKNTGRGMTPTARAVALMPHVIESLNKCRDCFELFKTASTETASRQFVIGMSDDFELTAGSALLEAFSARLPGIRVMFRQTNTKLVKDMLLARDLDIAVTAGGFNSLSLTRRVIASLPDAVIVCRSSLRADQTGFTVDDVCSRPHLLVQAGGFVGTTDSLLHQMGRRRVIRAVTSHFAAIPFLIRGTPLIVNAPVHVARSLCAACPDLCWFPQPLDVNRPSVQAGWRTPAAEDPLFDQAKELVIEVLQGIRWD